MLTSGLLQNAVTLKARLLASANLDLDGIETIDSVLTVAGDRVLVIGQTDASQNGIWVVASGPWTRAEDFDAVEQMVAGVLVAVQEGTVYAGSLWMFTTPAPIVVGTSDLSFAVVGPSFGGDVTVQTPNAAATMVDALRLLIGLVINTPGNEYSRWDWNMLVAGVVTPAYGFQSNAFFAPDLMNFLSDADTGFQRNGTDACKIVCGGNQIIAFNGTGAELAAGLKYRLSGNGAGLERDGGTGDLHVLPDTAAGSVQLGLAGLSATSTNGFPCIPAAAGAPTGVVTPPAGFAALYLNTTNGHLYTSTGGGVWVDHG